MTEVEPENGDGFPSILDQNCLIVWWLFGHRASFGTLLLLARLATSFFYWDFPLLK